MYSRVVFQKFLSEDTEVDLPEPVEANNASGRPTKFMFSELQVCSTIAGHNMNYSDIFNYRRKILSFGRQRRSKVPQVQRARIHFPGLSQENGSKSQIPSTPNFNTLVTLWGFSDFFIVEFICSYSHVYSIVILVEFIFAYLVSSCIPTQLVIIIQ